MGFVHLHLHTEYSLLDGECRISKLPAAVAEAKQTAVAITDHGVLYGAVDFYKACVAAGIKPIIGCEVYLAPRSMESKEYPRDAKYSHLILLAANETGYKNLTVIVSRAFTNGFYQKPRTDKDTLEKFSEGLICLSGCLSGLIPQCILASDVSKARENALWFDRVFGRGNFYLELQRHGIAGEKEVNDVLITLSRETGIPLVATNDVHYIKKDDSEVQRLLTAIQTGSTVQDSTFALDGDQYYFRSTDEMEELFADVPQAIANTSVIAERCSFDFDFKTLHLPAFTPPVKLSSSEYLYNLCFEGYNRRIAEGRISKSDVYAERLRYELKVIGEMGFTDYFLIVHDFVHFAVSHGIPVGPGRGSAVGSLAAFCLGITDVDPVRYGLLFERFLNPERVTMPDIDIDFSDTRRGEVIDYVADKYGRSHVAQIITFGTLAARQAVRDTGRALGMSYSAVDEIAKMIPRYIGVTLSSALEDNKELRDRYEADADTKRLLDAAMRLEGRPRNSSTHATGVVITDKPVTAYMPLAVGDNAVVTQYTMNTVADLGLLKIDFLGLRFLTILDDTEKEIRRSKPEFELKKVGFDDDKTYKMLSLGRSIGLFQLESEGMRALLVKMQPREFEDIISAISLYRPGPMKSIPAFLAGRADPSKAVYEDEKLKPILSQTYGCMLYQEQVMQICRALAGYTYGRADIVRRAMAKKKESVMQKERVTFVDGAVAGGTDLASAEKIFDTMSEFAKYAFNKSHAAAYAVVAYRTAYLKCNYPAEYMCALLNSVTGDTAKMKEYIDECVTLGINVLPPDVGESGEGFTICGDNLRFGLGAIKNVGSQFVRRLIEERGKRAFSSPADFIERVSPFGNSRMLESLIRCGACDSFGIYRSRLMSALDAAIDAVASRRSRNSEGQIGLFGDEDEPMLELKYQNVDEYPIQMRLTDEKYLSGLYLSGHPLDSYRGFIASVGAKTTRELLSGLSSGTIREKQVVRFVGIVTKKKNKATKNNKMMAFVTAEDFFGEVEIIIFPNAYEQYAAAINEWQVYLFTCDATLKENPADETQNEVKLLLRELSEAPGDKARVMPPVKQSKLYLRVTEANRTRLDDALAILSEHPGDTPICIYFEREKSLRTPKNGGCGVSDVLLKQLKLILGSDNVVPKEN